MSMRDLLELATFVVTIVALPFAVWVFLAEQRKERENEEEEAYLHLADAYNDFLKIVLANADLQLRAQLGVAESTRAYGGLIAQLGTAAANVHAGLAQASMAGMNSLAAQTLNE